MILVKGGVLSEVLKEFELQGYQLCIVDFKLWTIHPGVPLACIKGVLL